MSYQTQTKKILFKRKKHIKKLMNEISKRACSYILKDKRFKIETSALFEFCCQYARKKKEQRNTACDSPTFA